MTSKSARKGYVGGVLGVCCGGNSVVDGVVSDGWVWFGLDLTVGDLGRWLAYLDDALQYALDLSVGWLVSLIG